MGGKDKAERRLERHNDVFADIVNVLLFGGQRLIDENELHDASARSEYAEKGVLHGQERDTVKEWKHGQVRIASIGFENQTDTDSMMPLRVIGYDGAAYRAQLDAKDNVRPVVTVVLYFGAEHRWNASKSLLECMEVPPALKPHVNDYRLNVFEAAWLDDDVIAKFRSDFRIVAEFLRAVRRHEEFQGSMQQVEHMIDTISVIEEMSDRTGLIDEKMATEIDKRQGKGGMTMFDPIGAYVDRRVAETREEALNEGAKRGMAQTVECVHQLYKELIAQGKTDEMKKAAEDTDYLMSLLAERGLEV